jgi:hypothetical protein
MKRVIQTSDWNPFQTYMLVASLVAGVFGVFFPRESSRVVSDAVPEWVLLLWYTGLIVGAVVALIGFHARIRFKIQIEMMGVSILTFVSLGYSTLISFVSGRPFSYSVLLTVFFCLACMARSIQLYKKIKDLNKGREVSL